MPSQHVLALTAALQATVALGSPTGACPLAVTLEDYGSFTSTIVSETLSENPLPKPVDAWLGIDYATQPTGDHRFRPVTSPAVFDGVKAADKYGKICVQDATRIDVQLQDEACLNFNVYRTQGVSMDEKLPVLVWIHGGSFNIGSYKSFDGAAFAASSEQPIVVVNFHYRLNSLGFLPSALMEEEGLLNLGLMDQHLFLQFVQKHIASFGGDPDRVTLGGRSAGAHSTGIHYFHNYAIGDDESASPKPLFAGAIHQSGSVTARAFPNATYPLYEQQMEEYMSFLDCSHGSDVPNEESLACLRDADINSIREISAAIYDKYDPVLTWPFQPTQGGFLLEKFGSQSGYDGTFFHVPTITSTTTNEGRFYTPGNLETNEDWLDYLHNISPELTDADLALLVDLYPDPATDTDSPYAHSPNSTQYKRISAAWSDYAYLCPSQETAQVASRAGVPVYKLRFNTNQTFPAWQGIPHTADTMYTWDEPDVQHPEISKVYHAYLASFVASGDPNTFRWEGTPAWPLYEPEQGGDERPKQLVVQPGDAKVERDDVRTDACQFWRDPARQSRLNK
ncbi:para-nitrobenzyl esterase [Emericellopsis atlantica]|uniref:Carboxylic ester hydrolase n=1 Tax=Emericellopsis atlantica TaxID=2614577 RepID=A0A9P7ZQG6_9HYPO|nr:para-nitrobenzyl esterase [Emericellopsis atlantica]KAG9255783.1 para-nitrobenzyl esterase [Emericellopsis atlantica]